jgi:hypothetical protein
MWIPFPHRPDTIMNVVTVSGFGCKLITIIMHMHMHIIIMHMIRETISNRMQIVVFYVAFLTIFFVFSAQVGAG